MCLREHEVRGEGDTFVSLGVETHRVLNGWAAITVLVETESPIPGGPERVVQLHACPQCRDDAKLALRKLGLR